MTDDLESRIKALEEKLTQSKYPKVSSIQASGELKEKLDTFRVTDSLKKETFEEIVWKTIWKAEKVAELEQENTRLRKALIKANKQIKELE